MTPEQIRNEKIKIADTLPLEEIHRRYPEQTLLIALVVNATCEQLAKIGEQK